MPRFVRSAFVLGAAFAAEVSFAQEFAATCGTGQVPLTYGEHIYCSISPVSDQDVYQFMARGGETVRIAFVAWSNDLDPKIEILQPDGQPWAPPSPALTCSSPWNGICSLPHQFQLPPLDGMYTLLVSDAGNDNTGNYYLNLERVLPLEPLPYIDYGETKTIAINHGYDHDWLTFEGEAGTNVRLSFSGLSNDLDPRVRVWDPSGNVLVTDTGCDSPWNGICTFVTTMNALPETGTYTLMFYESGGENTGSFNCTLTCVWGNCPPVNPPQQTGSTFCASNANSTGAVATITAYGSNVVANNDVRLVVAGAPKAKIGIFFASHAPTATPSAPPPLPFSAGALCLASPLVRLPLVFTQYNNTMQFQLDLTSAQLAPIVTPGHSTYFQAWLRDPVSGPTPDTNTSNALEIAFQ